MLTMILKLIRKVLGLHMVSHLIPSSMTELQTDVAFPLGFSGLFHTKLIEVIGRFDAGACTVV